MFKKLRISISYPPLASSKGTPFLAQNRQFQWTNTGNVIYPVIPAIAATALNQMGHEILWDDAIAQNLDYDSWLQRLLQFKPDIVVLETKTPVVKRHWQIINDLKSKIDNCRLKIVLMGDHVTALPEESLQNSSVDYIVTGGDYDFMLLNLVSHLTTGTKLEPGFFYKKSGRINNTGRFSLKHHNLDDLPIIDRQLTQWQLYAYRNSNYKYKPGAYIMSARDCWWGKCTFCSWTTTFPSGSFRTFSVQHTINEIENLVNNYHVKEIFDDSGTLPVGPWLQDLCQQLINRGLNHKVKLGCNMRFAALNQAQYLLMAKAGFRFILYGLESSNQSTLDQIKKNTQVADAQKTLAIAKKAGLEPHLTVMIGYPWESWSDAQNTINQAKIFFQNGLADSIQATIVIPYPGTPLFTYCQKEHLLLTSNWNDYDMQQPVMKSPLSASDQKRMIGSLYLAVLNPKFLLRKILSIRSPHDFKFLLTYTLKFFQKLKDFSSQ
jgi:radical SAM superfamily enzyme YgiQ (UPF0313 family)